MCHPITWKKVAFDFISLSNFLRDKSNRSATKLGQSEDKILVTLNVKTTP